MLNNNILFDDWQTRCDGALKRRRGEYTICLICISILFLFSGVGAFFELAVIVFFVISLIALTVLLLEWQKINNNHIVIKCNQIEITNRFHKTTVYKIHIHELTLELRHSFNRRSGGIIMKFYDSKGNLICKYEDMLNRAAPWGFEKTSFATIAVKEKDLKQIPVMHASVNEQIKAKFDSSENTTKTFTDMPDDISGYLI